MIHAKVCTWFTEPYFCVRTDSFSSWFIGQWPLVLTIVLSNPTNSPFRRTLPVSLEIELATDSISGPVLSKFKWFSKQALRARKIRFTRTLLFVICGCVGLSTDVMCPRPSSDALSSRSGHRKLWFPTIRIPRKSL